MNTIQRAMKRLHLIPLSPPTHCPYIPQYEAAFHIGMGTCRYSQAHNTVLYVSKYSTYR
jgi:hypothetical protein